MKQNHNTAFARPISAVHSNQKIPRDEAGLFDKWELLTALTEASADFGLNHRNLSVLRALLSFHPDRVIGSIPHSSIVFPSNTTLSDRLAGMPESTLRRHLAALVQSGIVSRHDSANRKRFARGRVGDRRVAFGFDLSPLARMAGRILEAAQVAAEQKDRAQTLRTELAALRQHIITQSGESDLTDSVFKLLRRKPDLEQLSAAIAKLSDLLETEKTSDTDSHIERHIQPESKILSEKPRGGSKYQNTPELDTVLEHCTEYQSFFPEAVYNWQDLSRVAYAVGPMMGIDRPVYAKALQTMGLKHTVIAVLCMLETLDRIGNPGGYLHRLVQMDTEGRLDIHQLLQTAKSSRLSADNSNNRYNSII